MISDQRQILKQCFDSILDEANRLIDRKTTLKNFQDDLWAYLERFAYDITKALMEVKGE